MKTPIFLFSAGHNGMASNMIKKKVIERPEYEYTWSEKRKRYYKKSVSTHGKRKSSKVLKNIQHPEMGETKEYFDNVS